MKEKYIVGYSVHFPSDTHYVEEVYETEKEAFECIKLLKKYDPNDPQVSSINLYRMTSDGYDERVEI